MVKKRPNFFKMSFCIRGVVLKVRQDLLLFPPCRCGIKVMPVKQATTTCTNLSPSIGILLPCRFSFSVDSFASFLKPFLFFLLSRLEKALGSGKEKHLLENVVFLKKGKHFKKENIKRYRFMFVIAS